jgi:hypothetical protein
VTGVEKNDVEYVAGGGVPILETMEPGLGESVQLSVVERSGGMLMAGTVGTCRDGAGSSVVDSVLHVSFRSSLALSDGAVEI